MRVFGPAPEIRISFWMRRGRRLLARPIPRRASSNGWTNVKDVLALALAGVLLQQGVYRCAVADAGVSDLAAMTRYIHDRGGDEPGAGTRYWSAFMGEHEDEVSPIRLASRADAPILLIHGKDDTVVPFAQSQAMAAALRAAGKPVEFVVMPSEDHWLSREETRIMMLKASVDFVEKYNPPGAAVP
jgi:dipeptidyl aminopeptidase/acylaminoacyl peptidase